MNYAAFHNPAIKLPEAIGEGGAGWMYGQPTVQMHYGGWDAYVKAMRAKEKRLPPIDPAKARRYWEGAKKGAVVFSNFFEDRFDLYHAKQIRVALEPAKARGLTIAHYGFPSFDESITYHEFWPVLKDIIDIICPAYYATRGDPTNSWTRTDKARMRFQQNRAAEFGEGKRIGFAVSPFNHQGDPITATKLQAQINLLAVDDLFLWTDKPTHTAAVKAAAAMEMKVEPVT